MTGYGNFKDSQIDLEIEVSVKSVNGRYLDIRMHIPKEYSLVENEIKKRIGQSLRRGTVDVYIHRSVSSSSLQAKVNVQLGLARKWVKAYRQLGKELKLEDDLKLEFVANQPDVIAVEPIQKVSAQEKGLMLDVLKQAVDSCQKEREREGRSLQKDLLQKLGELESLVKSFEKMKEEANDELSARYEQRLKKFQLDEEVDPQRLAQEIIIQIDKADVSEEITRLREHVRAMKKLVSGSDSQGKKLDFYTQELLREVNTIGAKSQLAHLTKSVVDAKSVIEKIREQVQNIE